MPTVTVASTARVSRERNDELAARILEETKNKNPFSIVCATLFSVPIGTEISAETMQALYLKVPNRWSNNKRMNAAIRTFLGPYGLELHSERIDDTRYRYRLFRKPK